jgi:hypothetical protein
MRLTPYARLLIAAQERKARWKKRKKEGIKPINLSPPSRRSMKNKRFSAKASRAGTVHIELSWL